jgi:hypothetical protein
MNHTKRFTYRNTFCFADVVWLIGLFITTQYAQVATADTQAANSQSYSLWSTFGKLNKSDNRPVELGIKFRPDVDGSVSAVRFFRAVPINSGYSVHIWSATGELLGTGVAIEGQQPTPGWQTVQVYPPVALKTGVTYVASYYASSGQYSISQYFFTNTTVTNGPLHILGDGVDGGNGVFVYGEGGGFPTQSYNASNYWVDVVFTPTTLP